MRTLFIAILISAASASAAPPLVEEEVVLYVSGPSDAGYMPADFLSTTGIRVVDMSVPETVEWALANGLPAEAPSYPSVYSPEHGDFENEFSLGRSGMLSKQKVRGNAKKNAAKPDALRRAEDRLAKYLRSEGATIEPGFPVSRGELARIMAIWDSLNAAQADAKYAKYDRLLKPVLANGGSEYSVFELE